MTTVCMIITRQNEPANGTEWGDVWGFGNDEEIRYFGEDDNPLTDCNNAYLIVAKGGVNGIGMFLNGMLQKMEGNPHLFIHCNNLKARLAELGLDDYESDTTQYGLGDRNAAPTTTGKVILERVEKIKQQSSADQGSGDDGNQNQSGRQNEREAGNKCYGANNNAKMLADAEMNHKKKAMRSFFEMISPICVSEGEKIEDAVRITLEELDDISINRIVQSVRELGRLRCPLGELVEGKKWGEAIDWIKANRRELPTLAGRYL